MLEQIKSFLSTLLLKIAILDYVYWGTTLGMITEKAFEGISLKGMASDTAIVITLITSALLGVFRAISAYYDIQLKRKKLNQDDDAKD